MVISSIRKRRSIRKYLDKPVEREKAELLIEAALRAPSSMGRDPWEFVVVRDRSILDKLSMAKPHGSSFLRNADLGIVVCADRKKSDVWIEDTSIASTHIFLTAESIGLGACWIQIRKRNHSDEKSACEYVRSVLRLPEDLEVLSIIAIGYPDEAKKLHEKEDLKYDRIHYDIYGNR